MTKHQVSLRAAQSIAFFGHSEGRRLPEDTMVEFARSSVDDITAIADQMTIDHGKSRVYWLHRLGGDE